MNKMLAFFTILIMFTINVNACEGWKSEYIKLASKTAAYGVTYTKYSKGKFSEEKFERKKEHLLKDILNLQSYVKNTESCNGKEDRKNRLLSWISKTIEIIKNNSDKATELAKQIRNDFY